MYLYCTHTCSSRKLGPIKALVANSLLQKVQSYLYLFALLYYRYRYRYRYCAILVAIYYWVNTVRLYTGYWVEKVPVRVRCGDGYRCLSVCLCVCLSVCLSVWVCMCVSNVWVCTALLVQYRYNMCGACRSELVFLAGLT